MKIEYVLVALSALVATGEPVRALVRDPTEFAAPDGVQVVQGDFNDDTSMAKALEGVDCVLLAGRDSPDSVSQHRRVLAQVRRARVRHVVKLSAIGASSASPIALMREHHEVDEEVRKGAASWTLLKPHLYMQNLLRAANAVRRERRLAAPMGRDRFPLVDTRDVGGAAARVLSDPAAHSGKEYVLTGPVAVSYEEVAKALTAIVGRAVIYEAVAPAESEERLLAVGMPDSRAYDLAHIALAYGEARTSSRRTLQCSSAGSPDRYSSSWKITGMPIPPSQPKHATLHRSDLSEGPNLRTIAPRKRSSGQCRSRFHGFPSCSKASRVSQESVPEGSAARWSDLCLQMQRTLASET